MIAGLNFVSIIVKDQDAALAFWTNKVGFQKRANLHFKGLPRFLTVAPEGQPEPEIVLVQDGASNIQPPPGGHTGLVFRTDDCKRDYAILKERGVSFRGEPMEMPFGIQALFSDPDGNLFFLAEPHVRSSGRAG